MKYAAIGAAILTTAVAFGGFTSEAQARGDDKGPRIEFSEIDTNSDGQISLEEFEAQGDARFASIDADNDGAVTLEELVARAEARDAERMEKRISRMFDRMDANEDGKLTQDELQGRRDPAKMFERIDANSDGVITEEEIADMKGKMGKRGGKHKGEGRGKF